MSAVLRLSAMVLAGILDLLIGDPHGFPHPVRAIGYLIKKLEKILRHVFPETAEGEIAAGILLDILVIFLTGLFAALFLRVPAYLAGRITRSETVCLAVRFFAEVFLMTCLFAARSLRDESMKVYRKLAANDLPGARKMVSMIVGRDTDNLDAAEVTRAAVETIAEGTSDGVIAPLFYLAIGGPVLGWMYKAVNTMDSMIGYRNERYLYFGRAAARTDDAANFLPSRLAGILMILSARILRLDAGNAARIFFRDRLKHLSPNSAQTESACAGALDIQLGGDSRYFGKIVHKPTLGDPIRRIEKDDIRRADRLMLMTSLLGFLLALAVRALIL